MEKLRIEDFQRTCSSGDGTPVYRVRKEYLNGVNPYNANGRNSSYDENYAEFESGDLKALCKRINKLSR